MKRIFLAASFAAVVTGSALAQQAAPPQPTAPVHGMDTKGMGMDMKTMPDPADPASTAGYKAAMMKMMMAIPTFSGDADADFMTQMRPHHQAAIDMAKVVLASGSDAEARKLAQEIVVAQEREIAVIDAWLMKSSNVVATTR